MPLLEMRTRLMAANSNDAPWSLPGPSKPQSQCGQAENEGRDGVLSSQSQLGFT